MTQVFTLRTTLLGFFSWLIPLGASILFFDSTGHLRIEQPLFKSLMVDIGGGVGVALLVVAFRRLPVRPVAGLWLGLYWLGLNWLFDLAVLVPLTHMTLGLYATDIGLRYLMLPMISTGMGFAGAETARRPG